MRRLSIVLLIVLHAAMAPAAASRPSYAQRAEVKAFIARMADEHGFDARQLERVFREARYEAAVIKAIKPPADPSVRSWEAYRSRFLNDLRIETGLGFWEENATALEEAQARYGIPSEIIVAIIGIETIYGRHTGRFNTVSALSTLAFDYPPRSELFLRELEQLFLLAREMGQDPGSFRGSYAGALGLPQFLPSSYRNYATDFDGDGRIDLLKSPRDAIGSVARFLHDHGWNPGGTVAVPAQTNGQDVAPLIAAGIVPSLSPGEVASYGVVVEEDHARNEKSTFVDLVTPGADTEYWLGFQNFYVLTRYNRSSFYAMAVYQLSQALAQARNRQ